MSKGKKSAVIVVLVFICLTLLFIWGNSLVPKNTSTNATIKIHQNISPTLDKVFGEGAISHFTFRKFIHFFVFFVLSTELLVLFSILKDMKLKNVLYVLPLCLVVAIIDESLQILTKRGASIFDVLIDFIGATTCALIYLVISLVKSKKNKTKNL